MTQSTSQISGLENGLENGLESDGLPISLHVQSRIQIHMREREERGEREII